MVNAMKKHGRARGLKSGERKKSQRGVGTIKVALRLHPAVHRAATATATPSLNSWVNRVLAERLGVTDYELPDRRGRPASHA